MSTRPVGYWAVGYWAVGYAATGGGVMTRPGRGWYGGGGWSPHSSNVPGG